MDRNGSTPCKETFPNGSEATWFCGHMILVKAPGPTGRTWQKSFRPSVCDNRKYGDHSNAIKRGGRWFFLIPTADGYEWRE